MMEFDEETIIYNQIFQPGFLEKALAVVNEGGRFVYYTSAETAMKILRNGELWFRNAMVMNDYSEISYGLRLISAVFSGREGERFKSAIEDIYPGTIKRADELLTGWMHDWEVETYIACVSVHNPDEDSQGRLSMWRAYGDTAIVINNTPMTAITDLLAVYSLPVLYFSEADLSAHIAKITDAIVVNRNYLKELGQDILSAYVHNMLFRLSIATKHPGFSEEKEWRIFYRPTERESPGMMKEVVVLNGVPQKIYKLRLVDEPENGLYGADIPTLLDRIIVGPTEFPFAIYQGFVDVLCELGVEEASNKVVISDIPLRSG